LDGTGDMVTRSVRVTGHEAVVAHFLSDLRSDLNYNICGVAGRRRAAAAPAAPAARGIAPRAILDKSHTPEPLERALAGVFASDP
jgi:hypothetical protein